MKNLAKTCVIVTAFLVVADAAWAVNIPVSMPEPFVIVSVQREPADLGTVWGPGPYSVLTQLYARVVANCPYHVAASFRTFRHEKGKAVISAKDLSVAVNNKEIPVEKGRATVVSSSKPTSAAGVEVPLALLVKVTGANRYPQGSYRGALVITVMAGP
ncbi:MAG: hypothetical protein GXY19_10240 [Phycisphaerae bacterium]|nr:hypothetical protein [Phycisphaerae bacterium]